MNWKRKRYDNPPHSGNYVRYPSKKRSLRTWRNFYNLFPWLAVADGWSGKKSSRYPRFSCDLKGDFLKTI